MNPITFIINAIKKENHSNVQRSYDTARVNLSKDGFVEMSPDYYEKELIDIVYTAEIIKTYSKGKLSNVQVKYGNRDLDLTKKSVTDRPGASARYLSDQYKNKLQNSINMPSISKTNVVTGIVATKDEGVLPNFTYTKPKETIKEDKSSFWIGLGVVSAVLLTLGYLIFKPKNKRRR